MASAPAPARLTSYAHGGGCACKIPPGALESVVAGLVDAPVHDPTAELIVGLEDGDDAAAVRIAGGQAVISTADFFTPVVDDPYDWGRIAAANALSDVYAMGGTPIVAINLLCWPMDVLPYEMAGEVLRGAQDVAGLAGCHVAGGHSVDDPEPKYGMAVTGIADPDRLLRNDTGRAGVPLSLTKPLGIGMLNSRHKNTGAVSADAAETMTRLNDVAARATDVAAVIAAAAVPYLEGARQALADGFVSGGTRRNLDWVRPHLAADVDEDELLLLADAQTSGGLLVAGEVPGAPVIGELVPAAEAAVTVR